MRTCNEYVAKPNTGRPCDYNTCTKSMLYYTGTKVTQVTKTRAALQAELFNNGPVYGGITCWSDFMTYKGGIYSKTSAATNEGGHAVSIIGWGTDGPTFYWIVANSWVRDASRLPLPAAPLHRRMRAWPGASRGLQPAPREAAPSARAFSCKCSR